MKNITRLALTLIFFPLSLILLNAQQLKVTGGNLKVNNSSLVLQDLDFVNNGTLSSTDGNVVFTGTATNVISGTSSSIFDSLTINKTSGKSNWNKILW